MEKRDEEKIVRNEIFQMVRQRMWIFHIHKQDGSAMTSGILREESRAHNTHTRAWTHAHVHSLWTGVP